MEEKTNPVETGKKKFSLINFFFGWMKSSPKEEPINPNREDGEPKTPEEIEAEEKARKESKKNAPKKGSAWPLIIVLLLIVAGIAIWQYTSKEEPKEEPKKEQPTTPTQPSQPGPGTTPTQPGQPGPGTQPTQPGQPGPGTQPTQPGQPGPGTQPTQPGGSQVQFNYDQSFDWSNINKTTQNNLISWETNVPVTVDTKAIIIKTQIKGYNGKDMTWLQIEETKGKVKNIFTETKNISLKF